MASILTVNQSHLTNDSTYVFPLARTIQDMSTKEIALISASIPFSWFNISAAQNNNKFTIIHPTSGANANITITLPDGGYELSDINYQMRTQLINAGYYIQNNTTLDQTVYCELRVNASTYRYEFVSYAMPSSLPSGFSAGSAITFPATPKGPQLTVPSTNIVQRLGFSAGNYPSVMPTSLVVTSGNLVPIITDVLNVGITCDTISNPYSSNSQLLTSIAPSGTKFGGNINYEASEIIYSPQQAAGRNNITFRIVDQNNRAISLNDTNIVLNFTIRDKQ